jgi:hypothetical protein
MPDNPYRYPAEKIAAARRVLLAPHPQGDAKAFAGAMLEFDIGMKRLPADDLDESARGWAATIRRVMKTEGIADPEGRETMNSRPMRNIRSHMQLMSLRTGCNGAAASKTGSLGVRPN